MQDKNHALYKICNICNQSKWYLCFPSKGVRKRRGYCNSCKKRRYEIKKTSTEYFYDVNVLDHTDIKVRVKLPDGKKFRYSISYEKAIQLVEVGMAVIVNKNLIHRHYNYKSFREMILTNSNFTCFYCGKFGDTIDHIVPKALGGISSPKNCVCACIKCNTNKGSLSIDEYLYYHEPLARNGILQSQKIEQQLHYIHHLIANIIDQELYKLKQIEDKTQTVEKVLENIEKLEKNISFIRKSVEVD